MANYKVMGDYSVKMVLIMKESSKIIIYMV